MTAHGPQLFDASPGGCATDAKCTRFLGAGGEPGVGVALGPSGWATGVVNTPTLTVAGAPEVASVLQHVVTSRRLTRFGATRATQAEPRDCKASSIGDSIQHQRLVNYFTPRATEQLQSGNRWLTRSSNLDDTGRKEPLQDSKCAFMRATALSTHSRRSNADSRTKPSPLGPKLEPGNDTTCASHKSLPKKSRLRMPPGVLAHT